MNFRQDTKWHSCAATKHASDSVDSFILSLLTSKQVKVVRIEQLEAEQGKNNFKRERTPIYKVSIKQLKYVVKIYEAHLEINEILVKIYIRDIFS